MPRISRNNLKTITKTYHIIIRGNNKQDIFTCENDRKKFINLLKETKEEYSFRVYLFVLMTNHVHFVIYDENNRMSKIMHKLCSSYAKYFNKEYNRVGHLFQDRYRSISVNDDKYLFNLIRYIHNNPCKAKMSRIDVYEWSSYQEYIGQKDFGITDTDFILSLFGEVKEEALKQFIKYNAQIDNKEYLKIELETEGELSDEDAIQYIKMVIGVENLLEILLYSKETRNKYIYKITQIEGIQIEQIVRLLGISKRTIMRIIENNKK